MNQTFSEVLASFDYALPPELIAKEPAHPRDSARLLIYDRKNDSIKFDVFSNLIDYLPENALIVMNKTKVVPAKFTLKKTTGGLVSALLLGVRPDALHVLASGSIKPGEKLIWEGGTSFTVIHREKQEAHLKPSFPIGELKTYLEKFGETPLPPYMKDSPLEESRRRTEYQTVYAEEEGSIAAPTAGLHFTEELIKKCVQSGRGVAAITLHVHLGTFSALTEEQWKLKRLHNEYFSIDAATVKLLNDAKAEDRPIVAVGTTTVRTLEAASDGNKIKRSSGATDLFITEHDKLHFVDALITNFHVPKSSLLMLVSAFTGREKLLKLYKQAIDEHMRFFSFGDAMLIP